jgi:hypothetical protein
MFETAPQAIDNQERVDSFQKMVQTLESQMEGIDERMKKRIDWLRGVFFALIQHGNDLDQLKKNIWYNKEIQYGVVNSELLLACPVDGYEERAVKHARHMHAAIGMLTESVELIETLFKTIYLNQSFDKVNVVEELGDQQFYNQMFMNVIGVDIYEVMRVNQSKLAKRYGEKLQFSSDAAINRDHEKERQVMESEHQQQ